jgi:branched-chain amino acid transport system substrate-binding protein
VKKSLSILAWALCLTLIPATSVWAKAPVKIAAIFAKTGIAAGATEEYIFARFAVQKVNERGGILGRPLVLVELDNQSTALGSKIAAQKAVEYEVLCVIGASWSSHSIAMAGVLQDAGIPMITPLSTNPEVTLQGDYIFRACFTDPFQGKIMAMFAKRDLKAKSAAILINTDSDYSLGLSKYFRDTALESGIKIKYEAQYIEKQTDFSDLLKKLEKADPDVVFLPSYYRDGGMIIQQARKLGIDSIFLGGDGWLETDKMYELAGEAIDGSYFSTHWHPEVTFKHTKRLLDIYEKYKEDSASANDFALIYDSIMLFADAVRRAGEFDRAKVRDALAETKDFKCSTGGITFNDNGDPIDKDAVICKLEDGKSIFIRSIKP